MLRFIRVAGVTAMLLACTAYAADWAFWRVRSAQGSGTDTVEVSQVSVASLKGNKEEYFSDGALAVACSRSAFPLPGGEGWTKPCWWLRRHAQMVERY